MNVHYYIIDGFQSHEDNVCEQIKRLKILSIVKQEAYILYVTVSLSGSHPEFGLHYPYNKYCLI